MNDFGRTMNDILNYGALNLAMAIGYKKRLFDVMEDMGRPASIKEISELSGLNRRYVQEWLGVMTTGRIIEIAMDEEKMPGIPLYHLPREHAAFLTRRAGAANMGVYTQEIPLLTSCAMEAVERGFDSGEGVPFSVYPEFQGFMSELSNAKHRQVLVEDFLPDVDGGKMCARLEKGIRVCDVGCGEGVALNLMARCFPDSCFTGIDNHAEAIETAKKEAVAQNLDNVTYVMEDAALMMEREGFARCFDYIMAFDAIHDQTRPLEALKGICCMLAENGIFSMVDIDAGSQHLQNLEHPMGPFLYTVSLMHCMPVGLADNGMGLGMMWGRERALGLLGQSGFDSVEILEIKNDSFNVHYQCRKICEK